MQIFYKGNFFEKISFSHESDFENQVALLGSAHETEKIVQLKGRFWACSNSSGPENLRESIVAGRDHRFLGHFHASVFKKL